MPLYTEINIPPFSNSQYSPLYFEISGNFLKIISGNTNTDQLTVYRIFRALNIFINITTSIVAAAASARIWQLKRSQTFLIFMLSFLSFNTIYYAVRPDSLKTLFIAISFYYFVRICFGKEDSLKNIFTFIAFGALAIFTKQDAVIIFAAMCLFGVLFSDKMKWIKISSISMLTFVVIFGLLLMFYGNSFIENITLGTKFNFSGKYFYYATFSRMIHWYLLIAIGSIMFMMFCKNLLLKKAYLIIFILSFIGLLIISFKWGAGPNYFQDSLLLFEIFILGFVCNKTNENPNIVWNYSYLLIPVFWVALDIKYVNIKMFDNEKNRVNKELIDDTNKIVSVIPSNNTAGEHFYLYTFEKQICNSIYKNCLFPAYETNDPQYLGNTVFYGNRPKGVSVFSDILPKLRLYNSSNLFELANHKKIYSIMSKGVGFIEYYGFEEVQFTIIDSSKYFYLYEMKN